jgi:hypothetical protein
MNLGSSFIFSWKHVEIPCLLHMAHHITLIIDVNNSKIAFFGVNWPCVSSFWAVKENRERGREMI